MSHAPLASDPTRLAGHPGPDRATGTDLERKEAALYQALRDLPSIVVAYSGGVDSAYLAYAAHRVLGPAALCVTADSPSYPERHRALALRIARDFGFAHKIIRTGEMLRAEYRANPANRCYYCKHELYTHLTALARGRGIPVIADGSNADDRGDYRPGRQAAREFDVRSPLDAAGLTKDETWGSASAVCGITTRSPGSSLVATRSPVRSSPRQPARSTPRCARSAMRT